MVGRRVIRLPLDERLPGRVHWVLPGRFRGEAAAAAATHLRSSQRGSLDEEGRREANEEQQGTDRDRPSAVCLNHPPPTGKERVLPR
jgi:hypothetical protein